LNSGSNSEEVINAIDRLYRQTNHDLGSKNPISELISPEWHYSESIRILDNTKINWENLAKDDLIRRMADSLEEGKFSGAAVGVEFERSFCSWYQPYHYLPRQKWGMHLRDISWMKMAEFLYHECPSKSGRKLDCVSSAFFYFYFHDLFHNIVENATSAMEILLGKGNIYKRYYSDVYSSVFNSSNCLEEALSNSYLYLWAEECHLDRDLLREELLKQGPGYHDFIQYVDSNFSKGNRILISQIRHGNLHSITHDPIEQLINFSHPIHYSSIYNMPVWLHHKARPLH
jgi:hypothetical protein